MRVIRVQEHGEPKVLELSEAPQPEPGPGQVVVQLAAAGVNYIDVYHRTGFYPRPTPLVPGLEGAGTVVAVGEGVTWPAIGDRVASVSFDGAYAEFAVANAGLVAQIPAAVSDEVAAATLLQGMTAHYLLFDSYPVRIGETILVHAAAGGMGLLLTQLATKLGVRVIGTVSTPEKAEYARQAGAVEVIGYDTIEEDVRRITDGEGVAAVYDGVGQATFDASLACLKVRGTLVTYGQSSGEIPPLSLARLAIGSFSLTRPVLGHFIATAGEFSRRASAVLGWVAEGSLDIRIGGRYPLEDASQAHEDLENRRTAGKLILTP